MALHNLSPTPRELRLDVGAMDGCDQVVDLLDDARPVHEVDGSTIDLTLRGYAHHWFRLQDSEGSTPP